MPRPQCCRRVAASPRCDLFKPAGVSCASLDEIVLTVDELEAMRLADSEGMYQEQAAEQMNISRQTFGRTVQSARRKVAQALTQGRVLRIEGGAVEVMTMRRFQCSECRHVWDLPHGTGRPCDCPQCESTNIHRTPEDHGGGGGGLGRGRCCGRGRGGGMRGGVRRVPQDAPAGSEEGQTP